MNKSIKFLFDLDGTVTSKETLPVIAKHFNIQEEIEELTAETIKGNIPFVESFIRRVGILGKLPVDEINDLLETVPLYQGIHSFIKQHRQDCFIVTGNVFSWVEKLSLKVGCGLYSSEGVIEDNKVKKLKTILKKENVVKEFQNKGDKVCFIGEGNNDAEAMRLADVSIAFGVTHMPANSVLNITDYLIFEEETLCRQLNQLF